MLRIKKETSNCKARNKTWWNVQGFLSSAFQFFSPKINTDNRLMCISPERFSSITYVCVFAWISLHQSVSHYTQYSLSCFLVNLITNLRNRSSSKWTTHSLYQMWSIYNYNLSNQSPLTDKGFSIFCYPHRCIVYSLTYNWACFASISGNCQLKGWYTF